MTAGSETFPPATGPRPEADGSVLSGHGGVFQRSVCLAARPEEQQSRYAPVRRDTWILVSGTWLLSDCPGVNAVPLTLSS